MQIELAPEVEAKLAPEASSPGLTAIERSKVVLPDHAAKAVALQTVRSPEQEEFLGEYIARMKARSPGWETRNPYAVDWRATKAEGRRY